MSKNEDTAQRAMRLSRDRIWRATGENKHDPEYQAALRALQIMREQVRQLVS
jgi:hypothetical protein